MNVKIIKTQLDKMVSKINKSTSIRRNNTNLFLIRIIIILIIATVFFLRFIDLGNTPPGIALDEANYGYDAYSILMTGSDMWGEVGSSLKSLGEYKPAGLTFTLIPFIKYLGLSTLATRLPSAIYGFLTLFSVYLVSNLLVNNKKISIIATIVFALSPWHFGLSRQYYESISGLFYISLSIYFQLKYLKNPKNIKNLFIAIILSSISGFYYQVLRYLGLGILVILVVIKNIPNNRSALKQIFLIFVTWSIFSLPILKDTFSDKGLSRLFQENSIRQHGDVLVITEKRQMCYLSSSKNPTLSKICYLWWNKPGEKIMRVSKQYLELISPSYLFNNNYQSDVVLDNTGAYLEIMSVFYLLGLYYLIKNIHKKEFQYILITYLFSILPIALSFGEGIQRNVVSLFLAMLICIYGLKYSNQLLKKLKKHQRIVLTGALIVIFMWTHSRYIADYFLAYTKSQPEVWHSDARDLMEWLIVNKDERQIVFSDYSYGSLYYAFYSKYDPNLFRVQAIWTHPDDYGAINIRGINNLISSESDQFKVICAHKDEDVPSKLLVITGSKPEWNTVVQKQTTNFSRSLILHEVYDTKKLYDLGVCSK